MDYELVRVILASPNDVAPERKVLGRVIERLNGMLASQNILLKLYQWETCAYPGFHRKGRQCKIDDALDIEKADLFIAILWKRFGTPVHDARSGTEHEFNLAYKSYLETDRPHIMFYFKNISVSRLTKEELKQYRKVKKFRDSFPEEGLWWTFRTTREFEEQLFNHLVLFINEHYPLSTARTSRVENRQASEFAVTSKSTGLKEEISEKRRWPGSNHIVLREYFRIHFRPVLACAVLLFVPIGVLLSYHSKLLAEREQLARVIEKDVDSGLQRVVLLPLVSTRGEGFSDLNALPSTPGRILVQLILHEPRAYGFYDVSLVAERSDATLHKLTGIEARDKVISFTLNQELLPEGRYRFILSRDTQVLEFYLFVIDR